MSAMNPTPQESFSKLGSKRPEAMAEAGRSDSSARRAASYARPALPLRLPPCALRPRAIFLASQAYTLLHLLRHSPRAASLRLFLHALLDETALCGPIRPPRGLGAVER